MEKQTLPMIIQDLKSKRDALSLAHEQLKKDNDDRNKCIIVLSLTTGMFESMKIKNGLGKRHCSTSSNIIIKYYCFRFSIN